MHVIFGESRFIYIGTEFSPLLFIQKENLKTSPHSYILYLNFEPQKRKLIKALN